MKPLIYSSLHLKSLETYQNYLLRRPKNVHTFQFSAKTLQQPNAQKKFSQVLSLLRPIRKVDLGGFELNQDCPKPLLLQAFKKISKVKILSLSRAHKDSIETALRYFPQIKYLKYYLNGVFKKRADSLDYSNTHYLSALEHLRYCSKLKRLFLRDSMRSYLFKKTSTKLKKSLDPLPLDKVLPRSMRRGSNELIYTRLYCYLRNSRPEVSEGDLNFLPDLSNLQELWIRSKGHAVQVLGVDKALQKIATKKSLKQVKLVFDQISIQLEGILEPLIDCKLTLFSFSAHIDHEEDLQFLEKFLKNMNQLKYLKIKVSSYKTLNPHALNEICKHISNLEALQHLKLAFFGKFAPNFLPYLHRVFTKPIKLETLRLSWEQVNYDETMQNLPSRLQGLQNSILNLELNLETSPSLENEIKILQRVELTCPFCNVKKLRLLHLLIDSDECLGAIVEFVLELKYLEVLKIGNVYKAGPRFKILIGKILMKKGFKIFCCKIANALYDEIREEQIFDFKKILRANPYLEQVQFNPGYSDLGILQTVHKWS